MSNFIPERPKSSNLKVAFYEDNPEVKIPGWRTRKTQTQHQREINDLLLKLGAGAIQFAPGRFPGSPERHGYQIHFSLNGIAGRLDCAALPIQTETAIKKDRALAQALFLLRHYLQAELYSVVYRPGTIPLLPYLVGVDGKTVTEALAERRELPELRVHGYLTGSS